MQIKGKVSTNYMNMTKIFSRSFMSCILYFFKHNFTFHQIKSGKFLSTLMLSEVGETKVSILHMKQILCCV